METSPPPKKRLGIAILSQLMAIADHAYLATRHYKLQMEIPDEDSLCHIGTAFNCDAVGTSAYAYFAGLPLAVWAVATNFILFVMILRLFSAKKINVAFAHSTHWLSLFVAFMSVVMGGISVLLLKHFCLYCIIAYALSFVTFFAVATGLPSPQLRTMWDDVVGVFKNAKAAIFLQLLIPFLAFSGHAGFSKLYKTEHIEQMVSGILATWKKNPVAGFTPEGGLIQAGDSENAKMTIVEFADFRCGHCAQAAPSLDTFIKSHPDVKFVFRLFPLDGECNPHISNKNGVSCRLAKAAYCADEQQKGWNTHDWIFTNQAAFYAAPSPDETLRKMAQELGIEEQAFFSCINSDKYDLLIKTHADEAFKAGVKGTPSIFVNNRALPVGFALPVLQGVYQDIQNHGQ